MEVYWLKMQTDIYEKNSVWNKILGSFMLRNNNKMLRW